MRWTETVTIDKPVAEVFEAVRDQRVLMRWSAWPDATGYSCAVEGDGRSVGSAIVFTDSGGTEQGRQRIVEIGAGLVRNRLRNRGPRGQWIEPAIDFRLEPYRNGTKVELDFDVEPPVPALLRPIANRYLERKVRPLHVEDLRRLKVLLETGEV